MSIANSIRGQIPPIHPEGYPFIGGFAAISLLFFWLWPPLGWIGTVLTSGARCFSAIQFGLRRCARASWWRRPTGASR